MNFKYKRVIPRDLFNESGLLFQVGHLYLELEKLGRQDMIRHDAGRFKFLQDVDGDLTISNVWLQHGPTRWDFWRGLNSRDKFGIWVMQPSDPNWDIRYVFTSEGKLHQEFQNILNS